MNDKKICFILCINSQLFYEECICYIQRLIIPDGYEVEVIGVTEAESMAKGYNEAMRASDAKYKVYMHQDVFIMYPYFLQSVLDIFASDEKIGMIGVIGVEKMPVDGVMWHDWRVGKLYIEKIVDVFDKLSYETYQYQLKDGLWKVQAIDGLIMITSKDIPWREDVFDGWDYYDVSQSMEMLRIGYKVVVPEQLLPWCLHDDGILNLKNHDKYRRLCLQEYPEFFEMS